jgi:hypothetical protein
MTSRARRDLKRSIEFIAAQPWGDPRARELEIRRVINRLRYEPEWRRVELTRGSVSIRAIRHRRVRNVFLGVRDTSGEHPPQYG